MERDAIEKIRRFRARYRNGDEHSDTAEHAKIMHDILRGYHGNVKLRLEVISEALGSTMQTLRREFTEEYSQTMNSFHEMVRLKYAEQRIIFNPDEKLMAIASDLGYDRESEFTRFFKRKKGITPSSFAREARARQETEDRSNDNGTGHE